MTIEIKGKEYTLGKLVTHHAMMAMELQDQQENHKLAITVIVQTVAESLINGMEKIFYDEITPEKLSEYSQLITKNLSINEIKNLYTDLMNEMNGGSSQEGKPKP